MNKILDLLFQGIYINPQQILLGIILFSICFFIGFGVALASVKDKLDNKLD